MRTPKIEDLSQRVCDAASQPITARELAYIAETYEGRVVRVLTALRLRGDIKRIGSRHTALHGSEDLYLRVIR